MASLLLTAFRPFGPWDENASWLALQAVTRDLPSAPQVATRLYPVDYDGLRSRLAMDLATPYDAVIHVGQAAGASGVRLEQFALNAHRRADLPRDEAPPLDPEGPAAYRTSLPVGVWSAALREAGVPAEVSLHAGDYLCNAAMYWSHRLIEASGCAPRVLFVHVPLDVSQAARAAGTPPSLPAEVAGQALRMLVAWAAAEATGAGALAGAGRDAGASV